MAFASHYVQQLADAAVAVVPQWLLRLVTETSTRITGGCPAELVAAGVAMARSSAPIVAAALTDLLEADVDRQRTNPLSVFRDAVRYPTAVLVAHDVPRPALDDFAIHAFPADVYGLSPASWADIDTSLTEPGLIWGAWKAKTILDRRRAEQATQRHEAGR